MWNLDDLICHETLVVGISKIYICCLGNNSPENVGSGALGVVDELPYDRLELGRFLLS